MGTRQVRIVITESGSVCAIHASRIEWRQKGRVPEATDIMWVDSGEVTLDDCRLEGLLAVVSSYLATVQAGLG